MVHFRKGKKKKERELLTPAPLPPIRKKRGKKEEKQRMRATLSQTMPRRKKRGKRTSASFFCHRCARRGEEKNLKINVIERKRCSGLGERGKI